jgi:hypothetical protein
MTRVAATASVVGKADAETSQEANPELDQVRALLKAHDQAFTNQDMNGVLACFTGKAAVMGSGPGEIWSGPDEIKVAYQHSSRGLIRENRNSNTSSGSAD